MNRKQRKHIISIYGHLYKRHLYNVHPASEGCYYCGAGAESIDHMPPLAWVDLLCPSKKMGKGRSKQICLLMAACLDCNQRLGDRPLFSLIERVRHIENSLLKKYENESSLWTDDEINEMGPEFRRTLKARRVKYQWLLQRIRHVQWRVGEIEQGAEEEGSSPRSF